MGSENADEISLRPAVPDELLERLPAPRVIAQREMAH
jgi:hypothetical protein